MAGAILVAILLPARADSVSVGGCIGPWHAFNCVERWGEAGNPFVRTVPQPADGEERAHASERERKWQDRCRPVIAQDSYGVPRYRYAAPGCEFGVIN
jgi:hypothetical protein